MKLRKNISLTEFTNTYVPFGILIVIAIMAAEMTSNLVHHRVVYSIWVAMALFIPAICLYILPGTSKKKDNYRQLLWTFGFLAYMVHFYYTVFVVYSGIGKVYAGQGAIIATSNFLVTLWWGLDVLLGWLSASNAKWIRLQRAGAHIYIAFTFFMSSVVLVGGRVSKVLGIVMAAAILISLIMRITRGDTCESPSSEQPA